MPALGRIRDCPCAPRDEVRIFAVAEMCQVWYYRRRLGASSHCMSVQKEERRRFVDVL